MRTQLRGDATTTRAPARNSGGKLSPYYLDETAFTLEEIRRFRGLGGTDT
jgi:hypothetical protein